MKLRKTLALALAVSTLAVCGALPAYAADAPILNVHLDVEVASMDPQIATDGTSFEVQAAVLDGLFTQDAAGSPIPAIAQSYELSEDGLTYTFHLRDAVWSNGAKVTANDFVFAWKRLVDPAVASEYAFIAGVAGILNADAISTGSAPLDELGVKAVDDATLVVTLDTPVAFFLNLMTFPSFLPANEEFFNSVGDRFATSPETMIYNGAFVLASYEPAATSIVLTKNPAYWDAGAVDIGGINYQVIKDSQQAMLSYQSGDLDVVTLAGEQVDLFKDDPEFVNIMAGYLWYVVPNFTVEGLNNINLRMAMALSFDKSAVANNVLKDGSIPANFAIPTLLATGPDGQDYRATASDYLKEDKAAAKDYWAKAKSELGKDAFTFTMLVEDTESAVNVAQFLKAQWESNLAGLTINLEQMPKKNRLDRMHDHSFELGLTRWGPDYADPMTYLNNWVTGNSNNTGLWTNADYDQGVYDTSKGDLTIDAVARWAKLKDLEKMVMDDVVIYPVYQKGNAVMIKSSVSGIEFHSVGINRVFKRTVKN